MGSDSKENTTDTTASTSHHTDINESESNALPSQSLLNVLMSNLLSFVQQLYKYTNDNCSDNRNSAFDNNKNSNSDTTTSHDNAIEDTTVRNNKIDV